MFRGRTVHGWGLGGIKWLDSIWGVFAGLGGTK